MTVTSSSIIHRFVEFCLFLTTLTSLLARYNASWEISFWFFSEANGFGFVHFLQEIQLLQMVPKLNISLSFFLFFLFFLVPPLLFWLFSFLILVLLKYLCSKMCANLVAARIKLLRNKRETQLRQMRRDIAMLLQSGQDDTARIRVLRFQPDFLLLVEAILFRFRILIFATCKRRVFFWIFVREIEFGG